MYSYCPMNQYTSTVLRNRTIHTMISCWVNGTVPNGTVPGYAGTVPAAARDSRHGTGKVRRCTNTMGLVLMLMGVLIAASVSDAAPVTPSFLFILGDE